MERGLQRSPWTSTFVAQGTSDLLQSDPVPLGHPGPPQQTLRQAQVPLVSQLWNCPCGAGSEDAQGTQAAGLVAPAWIYRDAGDRGQSLVMDGRTQGCLKPWAPDLCPSTPRRQLVERRMILEFMLSALLDFGLDWGLLF